MTTATEAVAVAQPPATREAAEDASIRPFAVDVPEAKLQDLRRRIAATQWPEKETVADDSQGVPLALMQDVSRYWATEYDWRNVEERLNALPQFITNIDGLDIHFIHVRSKHANALPIIVTHGWPASILHQLKILDPLVDPTAHGGSAADAFDVVFPSMPGYGFSGKPDKTGWDPARTARAWVTLMKRLGCEVHRSRRRLGRDRHRCDGNAGPSGTGRNSYQYAWRSSARRIEGDRYRRPRALRPFRRGKPRVSETEKPLCDRRVLRVRDGHAPTDSLRNRGLPRRPRGLAHRPW